MGYGKGYNSMPTQVEILARRRVFDGFFKIEEVDLRYERFDGGMTPPLKRLVFERGDSVAAMVYHRDQNKLLFLRQFRFPTYEKGPGWITEVVAGMREHGEPAADALKREILEESGYEVSSLEPIATFYVSPGGSSERITLFYVEVTSANKIASGGGLVEENEDIETIAYSPEELAQAVAAGAIQDAKTLIGILWFQNKLAREGR
ncbi:MAG TPA: NUDIX domain-containing protein [Bryobacteraceae bacterium]|nr:NUDIX domain-containing protein [Bryobacteraceae bacterium]